MTWEELEEIKKGWSESGTGCRDARGDILALVEEIEALRVRMGEVNSLIAVVRREIGNVQDNVSRMTDVVDAAREVNAVLETLLEAVREQGEGRDGARVSHALDRLRTAFVRLSGPVSPGGTKPH